MSSILRYRIVNLAHRGLLQVTGSDTFPYIQSVITNDLRVPSKIVYATFPNAVGRVLLDLMVYKINGNPSERQLMLNAVAYERYGTDGRPEDSLLIECDANLLEAARKTLFAYKIRRQVTISHACDYDLFALYPDIEDVHRLNRADLPELSQIFSPDLIIGQDPRIGRFSYRVISRLGLKSIDSLIPLLSHQIPYPIVESSLSDYHRFRYKMGLAEGKDDYKPCFSNPLESNIDYMNGLAYSKGQFTGKSIISRSSAKSSRKYRLMPIKLLLPDTPKVKELNLAFGTRIFSNDKQQLIGKLISRKGCHGLAVLKLTGCLNNNFQLHHLESGVEVNTWFPNWWPEPLAPKDYYLAQRQMKLIDVTNVQNNQLLS
ncbi:putative transferase CAF17 homolog, mitochondrial [Tetranychus urticae]|uniref:CAF17 C-terminal domain-containing protein n=1 Tax=Tetranychus urticae TaxID=32264 RepID=T1KG50_TETUR|nr:putative transferase CAF17 homolog, mitochondrial [Tetranychus urticae]